MAGGGLFLPETLPEAPAGHLHHQSFLPGGVESAPTGKEQGSFSMEHAVLHVPNISRLSREDVLRIALHPVRTWGGQSLSPSLGVIIHHDSGRAFVGLCFHQPPPQSCLRCAAFALSSSLPLQTVLELMLFTAGLARSREGCGRCQSYTAETAETSGSGS